MIIELNKVYNPTWIYADRGSGEYQIETLHKYGDQHPESGLKNKVKGFQFSQKIDVADPTTRIMESKPMKPFMVNQLSMCIERDQLILSPFDETLHKQLIDYEVVRVGANGNPVYTSINEHFVDALGLAFLAFVLEMPEITKTIDEPDYTSEIISGESPIKNGIEKQIDSVTSGFGAATANPWESLKNGSISFEDAHDLNDRDQPKVFEVSSSYFKRTPAYSSWGSRSGSDWRGGRSLF